MITIALEIILGLIFDHGISGTLFPSIHLSTRFQLSSACIIRWTGTFPLAHKRGYFQRFTCHYSIFPHYF